MDRRPLSNINITALVDVLLVLLVIMMLALPAYVNRLPVDLPDARLGGAPALTQALAVAITAEGALLMNGSPADLPTILRHVNAQTTVEVAADRAVRYEMLISVIAEVQAQGPAQISLLAR
jgi:biopolymer transport protein ExbD